VTVNPEAQGGEAQPEDGLDDDASEAPTKELKLAQAGIPGSTRGEFSTCRRSALDGPDGPIRGRNIGGR
jgi:hypothetical protein